MNFGMDTTVDVNGLKLDAIEGARLRKNAYKALQEYYEYMSGGRKGRSMTFDKSDLGDNIDIFEDRFREMFPEVAEKMFDHNPYGWVNDILDRSYFD